MSAPESPRAHPEPAGRPVSAWAIAAAVLLVLAVLAAGAAVVSIVGDDTSDDGPDGVPIDEPVDVSPSGDAPVDGGAGAAAGDDLGGAQAREVLPTGPVAYVTADGRVLVGEGAGAPEELAAGAAIGEGRQGAVAVAPTGDLLAYVRADGALVTVPLAFGPETVLATDVALEAVGSGPVLSWNPTGTQLSYLAVGTEDMVEPRSDVPKPLTMPGVYRVPLPEGALGHVVKVVDRNGAPVVSIGDPSTRSMVGVTGSMADDLLLLESVRPDNGRPYTIALGSSGSPEEIPTFLSADDPSFAPDGNFVVAVGPDKGASELVRIATDSLARTTLVSADRICGPEVSPDSTRIVYAAGEDCERLMLVSSRGGRPVDVTPADRPEGGTFGVGDLGWTPEGRFITFAECRSVDDGADCAGRTTFFDPDLKLALPGPEATTVAPIRRPLLADLRVDVIVAGPVEYEGTFALEADAAETVADLEGGSGVIQLDLADGDRRLSLRMQVEEGSEFAAGTLAIVDPARNLDRTFLVLGTPSVIGIRVVSITGLWITTDDLPFASGEFRVALRRR